MLNNQFKTEEQTRPGFLISTDAALLDINVIYHYLAKESYWAKNRPLETIQRGMQFSLCFGVYATAVDKSPQQIGFARVISDFATFAYLADVFILPTFQGNGLGKWLVEFIMVHPAVATLRRFTLYTGDAHNLYKQYGFELEPTPENHMVLLRQEKSLQ